MLPNPAKGLPKLDRRLKYFYLNVFTTFEKGQTR